MRRQTWWQPPAKKWLKLNCDAAITDLGDRAIRGVLWNEVGGFVLSFAMDIVGATITTAEFKAIAAGLKVVHARGYSRILIDSNSLNVVRMIQRGCPNLHPCFQLVRETQNLMRQMGECTISDTLREANQVTDCFAKFDLNLSSCIRIFDIMHPFISNPLNADLGGTIFPRGF